MEKIVYILPIISIIVIWIIGYGFYNVIGEDLFKLNHPVSLVFWLFMVFPLSGATVFGLLYLNECEKESNN